MSDVTGKNVPSLTPRCGTSDGKAGECGNPLEVIRLVDGDLVRGASWPFPRYRNAEGMWLQATCRKHGQLRVMEADVLRALARRPSAKAITMTVRGHPEMRFRS